MCTDRKDNKMLFGCCSLLEAAMAWRESGMQCDKWRREKLGRGGQVDE